MLVIKEILILFPVFALRLLKEPRIITASELADSGVAFLFGRIVKPEKLILVNMTIRK
jgi:hypothetical protein